MSKNGRFDCFSMSKAFTVFGCQWSSRLLDVVVVGIGSVY